MRSAERKSGHPEAHVGVDDADQRHAREVVPLGDHLRADQDVDLARLEARPGSAPARPGGCARSRSSRSTRAAGSAACTASDHLLGPEAGQPQVRAPARRAGGGGRASWPQ